MSGPRRVLVTGSVATDHLMAYRGRFADQIVPDRLDRVSLSFLADTLEVRPGGVAANIALGLARLGLAPVLAAAAGRDFGPYRSRLRDEGVETGAVHVSDTLHTARFVCTTDTEQNQIATFYAGAMAEARHIRIADVSARHGPFGMALIGPDDPRAMLLHTGACRRQGLPFAADPSQQLAALDRAQTRNLVTGSRFLFTNEYEAALLQERTGWTHQQVLDHTGTWIVTRGADGVDLTGAGHPPLRVPAVPPRAAGEPTGVGDGFRAGFLAATAWGRPPRAAARLGCALATVVLETVGPQQYVLDPEDLGRRLRQAYGPAAARELTPWLNRLGGETGSRPGGNRRAGGDTGPDLGGVRRAGGDTGADAVEDRRADEGTRSSRDEGRRTREDAGSGRRGDEGRRLDRPAGGVGRSVGGEGRRAGEGAGSGRRGDEGRRLDRPAGGVVRSVGGEGRRAGEGAGSGRRGDEGRRLDRPAGGVGRSVGGGDRRAGEGAGPGRCADEETRPYRPADGGGRSVQGGGRPAGAGTGSGGRADEVTPAVRRAGEGTRSLR
ncbi:PfkB family carbohydrate kinase, partial [Streptomyces sp. NPDC001356]